MARKHLAVVCSRIPCALWMASTANHPWVPQEFPEPVSSSTGNLSNAPFTGLPSISLLSSFTISNRSEGSAPHAAPCREGEYPGLATFLASPARPGWSPRGDVSSLPRTRNQQLDQQQMQKQEQHHYITSPHSPAHAICGSYLQRRLPVDQCASWAYRTSISKHQKPLISGTLLLSGLRIVDRLPAWRAWRAWHGLRGESSRSTWATKAEAEAEAKAKRRGCGHMLRQAAPLPNRHPFAPFRHVQPALSDPGSCCQDATEVSAHVPPASTAVGYQSW
ncbi:hypothetical protein G7046_g683 [Stylonectria norvegica]|nr:hypothetical protein G7046_g683 [Stylonectria norvegica]